MAGRPSWEELPQLIIENRWTVQEAAKKMACGANHIVANLQTAGRAGNAEAVRALQTMRAAAAEVGGAGAGLLATAGAVGKMTLPAWVLPAVVITVLAGGIYVATQWGTPDSEPVARPGGVEAILEERANLPEGEAQEPDVVIPDDEGSGQAAYYLVVVGNVSPKIYSVRSQESVDSGELLTCNFLNGGRCAGSIVDTPNGAVGAGADIPASFESKTLHTSADDHEARRAAWEQLCSELSDIRVAPLAAGYIGFRGDTHYTIDGSNGVSPNPNPCGFE
jgi:hypothetical protein